MKHSRFFSVLTISLLGAYGLVGFYFLPWANFVGDMTRLAKLPEAMFVGTRAQPVVEPAYMQSAEWGEADVLVIGDSFSMAQVWQTVFTRQGVRVKTESWGNISNICGDVSDWIRSKGFRGKYVIIESAEIYFDERMRDSAGCQRMNYHPQATVKASAPPPLPDLETHKYSGRMSVGIQTAWNALEYQRLSRDPAFKRWEMPGDVWLERLGNGCELFSHARCNDVLFYKKFRADALQDNVLRDMSEINARLSSYTVLWAVIPDKATVYLHPDKQFWDKAEHNFHAPNLLKLYRQAVEGRTVDLYLPNDTHVSTTGYLLLGSALYQHL